MKFFDLEMNGGLSRVQKKKGGTRDVYFEILDDHYGCAATYTDTAGQISSLEECNISGEWRVLYMLGHTSSCEKSK